MLIYILVFSVVSKSSVCRRTSPRARREAKGVDGRPSFLASVCSLGRNCWDRKSIYRTWVWKTQFESLKAYKKLGKLLKPARTESTSGFGWNHVAWKQNSVSAIATLPFGSGHTKYQRKQPALYNCTVTVGKMSAKVVLKVGLDVYALSICFYPLHHASWNTQWFKGASYFVFSVPVCESPASSVSVKVECCHSARRSRPERVVLDGQWKYLTQSMNLHLQSSKPLSMSFVKSWGSSNGWCIWSYTKCLRFEVWLLINSLAEPRCMGSWHVCSAKRKNQDQVLAVLKAEINIQSTVGWASNHLELHAP